MACCGSETARAAAPRAELPCHLTRASGVQGQPGVGVELPKIISVDDHVVEPAHVWQTWLPERFREKGPHVERKRWGKFKLKKGA